MIKAPAKVSHAARKKLEKLNQGRSSNASFLVLLLSADAFLILLHVTSQVGFPFLRAHLEFLEHSVWGVVTDRSWSLGTEGGAAESFQHVKEYWATLMFFWLFIHRFRMLYLGFSLLFAYVLLDDAFHIHEGFGGMIADYLGYSPSLGLRAEDFGEITIWAIFGSLFFVVIGIGYYRAGTGLRRMGRNVALMFLVLFFCEGMIDMSELVIDTSAQGFVAAAIHEVAKLVEDGGGMVIMSVICWYTLTLVTRRDEAPQAPPRAGQDMHPSLPR